MKYITPEIKYLKYLDEGCEKVVFDLDKYVLKVYKNTNTMIQNEVELSKWWVLFRECPYKVFGDNVLPETLVGYIAEKIPIGNRLFPVIIQEKVSVVSNIFNKEESENKLNQLKDSLDQSIKESKDPLGIQYYDLDARNMGIKDNKCVLIDITIDYKYLKGKLF